MAEPQTRAEMIVRLQELVRDIKFAMLTTHESDGSLHSRPMATLNSKFDGIVYFFTNINSAKVDEAEADRKVSVTYSNPNQQQYVALSGIARVTRDLEKMQHFWTPNLTTWFPKGLEDPEISLMEIHVFEAEYWDSTNSVITEAIGSIKAAFTGESYQGGENVRMKI